jgi:hypothetical protein
MKNLRFFTIVLSAMLLFSSCNFFHKVTSGVASVFKGKPKEGCPTNGKNVGAEKILSGDPKGTKAAKNAKKFRS